MKNAIEVSGLTKRYKNFLLDDVSFSVPEGFVCGFIGENGAGKTTTLKLMLGMAMKNGGEVSLLGKPAGDASLKEDLGVLLEQPYFQEDWTPRDVEKALRPFYRGWDGVAYDGYLRRFSIDPAQKYKTLSRGTKMKLGIAAALSHDARLLLLDEPTSGLDPVARDEVIDLLRDYMAGEDRTVFFSSHITSDIEKIADYLVYIHGGKIMYGGEKDGLLERYCLIRGGKDDLPPAKRANVIGLREHFGGFEGMIELSDVGGFPPEVVTEKVSLEDVMVYLNRNEERS
jgi:ABC-2 type transport system ATP-binding protein